MGGKSLKEIYALAVCFAAVIFLVVSVAMCLYQALRIVAPGVTVSEYEYQRSISDEEFMKNWPEKRPLPDPSAIPGLRAASFNTALQAERHSGVRSFLESLMYVVAGGLAFWVHWAIAKGTQLKATESAA